MKMLKIIIFIVFVITLIGCMRKVIYQDDSGWSTQSRINSLSKKINTYGVRIIQDESRMVFVLPNRKFFNPNSANFTEDAYNALDLIADFASYYEKSTVSVMGYAKSNDNVFAKMVAAERAHKVVKYLWKSKIDASLMYADEKNIPIIKNNGSILTNCVVIGFRKE